MALVVSGMTSLFSNQCLGRSDRLHEIFDIGSGPGITLGIERLEQLLKTLLRLGHHCSTKGRSSGRSFRHRPESESSQEPLEASRPATAARPF